MKNKFFKSSRFLAILVAVTAIFLPSCFSNNSDGAPKKHFNASQVANAIPKIETLNGRVNPKQYTVQGKKYKVLADFRGYNKTGVASWYGTKFHGKLTATGEKYDMLAMTAANKELPIPCYAEVTNLNNNKKVIVKINDRGPFVENRIIDLSYAAACKLGVTAKGTAQVRVRTIDPAIGSQGNNSDNVELYLQVGSFSSMLAAESVKKQISNRTNISSKVKVETQENGKKLFKLKAGPFENFKLASKAKALLVSKNFAKEMSYTKF